MDALMARSEHIRVLHVISGLSMGGAENVLWKVLSGGLAKQFPQAVVSLKDEGVYAERIQSIGIPVYCLNINGSLLDVVALGKLFKLLKQFAPDAVQGWMYHGNLVASMAKQLAPSETTLFWNVRHSLYDLQSEKPLTRQVIRINKWCSRRVFRIVYNSRLSREQHEMFGFSAGRGQVIPNGFDTDRLCPDRERGLLIRGCLDIPQEAKVIGHVARFHPMKDHASFLHAAVNVMRQRPDAVCLLVGRDVNLKNRALVGIVPKELEPRFRFVGERDDVPDLMRAMDVFCLSSAWGEAFPNVIGEAMALGVPCVATAVGDICDIVGETGEVVPPSDIESLARAILAVLDRSTEERMALGRVARSRIEERYALPRVVEQYRKLYSGMISK